MLNYFYSNLSNDHPIYFLVSMNMKQISMLVLPFRPRPYFLIFMSSSPPFASIAPPILTLPTAEELSTSQRLTKWLKS